MANLTLKQVEDIIADTTEDVANLVVGNPGTRVVVYSAAVTLTANDILQVFAQFEVTNNLAFNAGVFRQLLLASSPTAIVGTPITPGVEDNVSSTVQHHMAILMHGMISGQSGSFYINLVAAADASSGSGNITVEAGYGLLQAIVLRR